MVELGWSLVQPIQDTWRVILPQQFPNYKAGTWGPEAADELLVNDGRHWQL
jgi:glucose-6-phosphate 1-dehydrogenase